MGFIRITAQGVYHMDDDGVLRPLSTHVEDNAASNFNQSEADRLAALYTRRGKRIRFWLGIALIFAAALMIAAFFPGLEGC